MLKSVKVVKSVAKVAQMFHKFWCAKGVNEGVVGIIC